SHHTTSSIPLPSIPTAPIPTVTQTDTTTIIQYSRRARIAQSSALPTIADEPASPVRDDNDAPINGRRSNEGEAAAERISTDSEEIARVLTSLDAANIIAGETNVPTGSGFIPTAGPPATIVSTGSDVGPTASPIVRRRKGKEILVESDTPKKKKLQE
nr:hypothetical protein [Tanacetum cinerariifolium]